LVCDHLIQILIARPKDNYNAGYPRGSLVFEEMLLRQKSQLHPIVVGLGNRQRLLETETKSWSAVSLRFLHLFVASISLHWARHPKCEAYSKTTVKWV